ncbi:hypothetical protein MBLNU459_g8546t1 [Dothideomycetes sp. NU459]
MAFFQALPWHEGEEEMHKQLRVPEIDNPTVPRLSHQAVVMLQRAPLIAIGALDSDGNSWVTLWGGAQGLSQPLGNSIIGVKTPVAVTSDPVVETLFGGKADGQVVREEGRGRMVGGLAIDLETRKRVKIYGRMVAGALKSYQDEETGAEQGEVQLVVNIEQSLGNCPKYLNKKSMKPALTSPKIISESSKVPAEAVALIKNSDLFFISSTHKNEDMDVNHRGGPRGFVRVLKDEDSTALVWPEYSGNRLYQTLGNLFTTPFAGLCFADFETGNVLYLTGTTEILIGSSAAQLLPRSNLAVKFTTTAARYVETGLPFRGTPGEPSPYNPNVRYLTTEKAPSEPAAAAAASTRNTAKLLSQTRLTPTVSRFRFALASPAAYAAGQYVTLDLSAHLDAGYSHMRDDDPRSLNDDFVRTFTVSSAPPPPPPPPGAAQSSPADHGFEITIRRVGPVTDLLFRHGAEAEARRRTTTTSDSAAELEVGVQGFGGSFGVEQDAGETVAFVAGGVGITPLLPALAGLDVSQVVVLWAVRAADVELVADVVERHPAVARSLKVAVTGTLAEEIGGSARRTIDKLTAAGVDVVVRRLRADDVQREEYSQIKRWYLCSNSAMRQDLLQWLPGKDAIYEDFNF